MKRATHGVAGAGLISALALLPGLALAAETPLDYTVCRAGTVQFLEQSKEATLTSIDIAGVVAASNDKRFENMTSRCIGVGSNMNGKPAGNGFCKYVDPDGDVHVTAYTAASDKPGQGSWRFVHGTGKWAGIKGGGTYKVFTSGKPIVAGTLQNCNRVTGTFAIGN